MSSRTFTFRPWAIPPRATSRLGIFGSCARPSSCWRWCGPGLPTLCIGSQADVCLGRPGPTQVMVWRQKRQGADMHNGRHLRAFRLPAVEKPCLRPRAAAMAAWRSKFLWAAPSDERWMAETVTAFMAWRKRAGRAPGRTRGQHVTPLVHRRQDYADDSNPEERRGEKGQGITQPDRVDRPDPACCIAVSDVLPHGHPPGQAVYPSHVVSRPLRRFQS